MWKHGKATTECLLAHFEVMGFQLSFGAGYVVWTKEHVWSEHLWTSSLICSTGTSVFAEQIREP